MFDVIVPPELPVTEAESGSILEELSGSTSAEFLGVALIIATVLIMIASVFIIRRFMSAKVQSLQETTSACPPVHSESVK